MRAFILADADNPCLETAMRYMGTIQVITDEKRAAWIRDLCTSAKGLTILPVDLFEHGETLGEQLEKEVEG